MQSGGSGRKETLLTLIEFDRRRTSLVVIGNVVEPAAHGIASHQPSIGRLQHVGHHSHVLQPRIEPQIVTVRVEDDWHSVMDC